MKILFVTTSNIQADAANQDFDGMAFKKDGLELLYRGNVINL